MRSRAGRHAELVSIELGDARLRSRLPSKRQNVQYEDVYADKYGLRELVDYVNENASSNVRVRNVNDLNDLHAMNGLGRGSAWCAK